MRARPQPRPSVSARPSATHSAPRVPQRPVASKAPVSVVPPHSTLRAPALATAKPTVIIPKPVILSRVPLQPFTSKVKLPVPDFIKRVTQTSKPVVSSAPRRNLTIKAELDLPYIPAGSFQNYRFIRQAEEGPNRHYRHEVGLYEERSTGRKVFLKEIGSTEVQRGLKMEGKFTHEDAKFLVHKEVLAGRLLRIALGERHVPLTWVVVDYSLGKPTYYLASEEIPHYISMVDAAMRMGVDDPKDLFYVDSEGYTRIISNKNPRAGVLVHGRIAAKVGRAWVGEGDETMYNVGIAFAGKDAGYIKNIDLECCLQRRFESTPQQLVDGHITSVIPVLNLEKLNIMRRNEVREKVIRHIASIPYEVLNREFQYAFGDKNDYPAELRDKINVTQEGFFETHGKFRKADEIYKSREASRNAVSSLEKSFLGMCV